MQPITLRPYQAEDIEILLGALAKRESPVASVATGGGKGVYIPALAHQIPERILCVTDRQELIAQNEIQMLRSGQGDAGVYSAGLKRRETSDRVIFAGVQSIYKRMDELQAAGPFAVVIVDEAHAVPPRSVDSMYNAVLSACPLAQYMGLTATPYRLIDGPIYGQEDSWFTSCPVSRGISELTALGYLAPLVGVKTGADVDLSHVRSRGGDFVRGDLAQASSEENVVSAALDEICYLAQDRKSWLLFGVDVSHCQLLLEGLRERGVPSELIVGDNRITSDESRVKLIQGFKEQAFRALVNCEVLTTGFDAPGVDCVALLRASQSKGLITQMMGRGSRLSPETGKEDCLVLDLAGNLARHIPIDGIPEVKRSPKRAEADEQQREREEEARQARHGIMAARGIDPLADSLEAQAELLRVEGVTYYVRPAKKHPTRDNLIVTYKCRTLDLRQKSVTQFVLCEYPKERGIQARAWFERRGMTMPSATRYALNMARRGPTPTEILVIKSGKYDEILMEYFDE